MHIEETTSTIETDIQESFARAMDAWHTIRHDLAASNDSSDGGPDDVAEKPRTRSVRRAG